MATKIASTQEEAKKITEQTETMERAGVSWPVSDCSVIFFASS
jgi:hypothetical protein